MPLTIKQITFSLWFLISWLLLLLIGDSYISYVLIGGISFISLLFVNELDWKKIYQYKGILILWLLAFLGLGASFIFSVNVPLSLYSAYKFTFTFVIFWFFLLIKPSFITRQQLLKLLLLIGMVILLVSITFQFFPSLANLLPGLNLLHATYGHNHLAALLLLITPLSWWLASEYIRVGQSTWWWALPVLFSLGILFSFGRVAVVIGLMQFLVIYRQLQLNNIFKKKQFKFLFKTILGLFLVVLLSNTFFSTVTFFKSDFACPVPKLQKQLCKSISTESRPEYWQWAFEIIKDNLWLGSGPGTFGLVAPKYHLNPYGGSAHAHNAFLESLAEMGVAGGGLFVAFMFGLLYLAWKSLGESKKWDWQIASFLGVIAIYLDVLFDFDWEFIGIYGLTLLLLVLIFGDKKHRVTNVSFFTNFFKIIYLASIFSLIGLAGLYLKIDGLIKAKQTQTAFDIFPYFHWHRKIYETDSTLNDESKDKFYNIYKYQADLYPILILDATNPAEKQQLKEQLFELDPWAAVNQDLISYYLEIDNLEKAQEWIDKESVLYDKSYLKSGSEPPYEQQNALIDQSLSLVEKYLLVNKPQLAFSLLQTMVSHRNINWRQKELSAELLVEVGNQLINKDTQASVKSYQLSRINISWILNTQELWFEKHHHSNLALPNLIIYLELTADWHGEAMGWKDQAQYELAQQAVERSIATADWESLLKVAQAFEWSEYDYQPRNELIKQISLKTDQLVKDSNYDSAMMLSQSMNLIMPNDYWLASLPGKMALMAGDFENAKQLFKKCNDEWVEQNNEDQHWECNHDVVNREQFITDTKNRYFQVSQIIRGEAVWQDFIE